MAEVIRMPKMSDTMTEGVLAKWHVKVGDTIKSGDVLAEVETDKATMDLESYEDGTILYIGIDEGKGVPVDGVIAVVGKPGEDYEAALKNAGSTNSAAAAESPAPAEAAAAPAAETNNTGSLSDDELAAKGITVVRMPLLSDTMKEGVIADWLKNVGDSVKDDDVLAEVETDKATMEVMGYATGTLLYVGVAKGAAAPVNGIIAIVGPQDTNINDVLSQVNQSADGNASGSIAGSDTAEKAAEASATQAISDSEKGEHTADGDQRIKASPLARKIAKDKGIDITKIKGSADGGRIVKKDVENYTPAAASASQEAPAVANSAAAAPALPQYIGQEQFTEKPVTQMRKTIAKRLSESLFTAPHFYLTMSINMDSAKEARARINEFAQVKVSFNDLVIKAVAIALKQHPAVNSSWLGDKIRYNQHVNIGVAVAVEDGLLVPVVRFADGKSLSHISAEVKDFAARAKSKKLQPADWEGSTFTVSNLGMFGIDEFTAIINPPDACILAIGGIADVPVVKNGAVVPGSVMKVTLSCDHRVVDGATGAAFLQTLKALLEEPVRLLA